MKMAEFLVEQWLNPMDSKAKYNFGSSCCKALTMDELFRVTGQDEGEFLKFMETMSLHYHHGDSTGSPRIKNAVCGIYEKANLKPENVMMTCGGTGANDIAIMGVIERDKNVVTIKPSYQQHYDIPLSQGIETRIVELKKEDDYALDMDALRAAVDENTNLIILTNPNNPTGVVLGYDKLKELVEIAEKVGAYILCDEMYRGLDENYMPSILDFDYERTISVASMSKMFSMAGTRIGWIVTKDKDLYHTLENRRSYNTICMGIIDEVVASIALENFKKIWERTRSILLPNKKIVYDWVAEQPHLAIKGDAMGTTCLVHYDPEVYPMDSTTMAIDMMEKDQILVTHGKCFDIEYSYRVGYGAFTDRDWLREGLDHLGAYMKSIEK
ncbi:MAG: aminotransferase class I/II-fold pyridoxal phosphate-dependent enzyme [Clostridia bacterium]|nr:aminotransferase class I/II-fold pyridoxal phosphate-dependent enzyme [Clostridia bacterium]